MMSAIGKRRPPGTQTATTNQPVSRLERLRALLTLPYLAAAMLFGGGAGPLVDGAIEIGGVALGALALAAMRRPLPTGARSALALLAFVATLVAMQLIPLPVAWPGHGTAQAIRQAIGLGGTAMPLSLDPAGTRRSALSLLPEAGVFLAVLGASVDERRRLISTVCAVALFSALLGMVQLATGRFYPYPTAHNMSSVGLFTNRNHHADLLIAGMVMAAVLGRERAIRPLPLLLAAGTVVLLALAVVTTTSRGGTALMVPALAAALLILFDTRGRSRTLLIGGAGVVLLAGGALLLSSPVVRATADRFAGSGSDLRFDYWTDTLVAVRAFWPAGSGLGTFVPVYAAVQDLGSVNTAFVNHAHNDYLELALECGLAGVAGIVAYMLLVGRLAIRIWRRSRRADQVGALVVVLVLMLHSIVDYPLRMLCLMTLFGLVSALLIEPRRDPRPPVGFPTILG